MEFECSEGHVWTTRASNLIYKHSWCPECLSPKRTSFEDAKMQVEAKGFTLVAFSASGRPMTVRCPNGHTWTGHMVSFLRIKKGCPDCGQIDPHIRTKTRKYTLGKIREVAKQRLGVCRSLCEETDDHAIATAERGTFECADGHRWTTTFATILRGHWCPVCGSSRSR